jgi:hypothetical protein
MNFPNLWDRQRYTSQHYRQNIRTYVRTYIHILTHKCIHTHTHTHAYIHKHTRTDIIHAYTHTCIHTYIHTHTYIHAYRHTHTYMYIHIYIHGVTLQKTAVLKSHITQFRLQPSPITSASHFNIMPPPLSVWVPQVFRLTFSIYFVSPPCVLYTRHSSFFPILSSKEILSFSSKNRITHLSWSGYTGNWRRNSSHQSCCFVSHIASTKCFQAKMVQDVRDARKSGNRIPLLIGLKILDKTATFGQESRNGERGPIT